MLACLGRAAAQDTIFPRDQIQAVLTAALGTVLQRHLEQPSPQELALWSLRGLEVLEPSLKPELNASTLLLSANDRLLGARPLPPMPPELPREAAALPTAFALAALYEAAWLASPALRQAGPERMLRSGFEELFNHLDPYSRYLTPEEARGARVRRVGQAGLGLGLATGGGGLVVAALAPEGPAARAGLRPGDRLLAIDGITLASLDPPSAAALLEGPEDTPVTLRLRRGGRGFNAMVYRTLVPPESVLAERRGDTLWIKVLAFSSATDSRLAEVLRSAFGGRLPRPDGVVLDLRGNRGGLLGQAVSVAAAFLPGGVVAHTGGRHPDSIRTYLASGPDLVEGTPLVVLVDGRTASAAEIVAAALADRGRAVVVGSASMGKGLIQAVVPLPNDAELLVTWSRVLAPQGWPIQGLGVLPALCTSLGAEATAQGLAALRRGEAPMAVVLARQRAARVPVPASEVAQLRGSCPPAEGRDADADVARALLAFPESYGAALGWHQPRQLRR